jgi:4-alpha-glucanotransferase
MNLPGTVGPPNWSWRLRSGALSDDIARRLQEMTVTYGRRG